MLQLLDRIKFGLNGIANYVLWVVNDNIWLSITVLIIYEVRTDGIGFQVNSGTYLIMIKLKSRYYFLSCLKVRNILGIRRYLLWRKVRST